MAAFCYYLAWEVINISLEYTAGAWLKLPRFFLVCVAVNLLTHPLFTLFLFRFGRAFGMICICELVILAVEAAVLTAIYGRVRWRRATLASLVMNGVSFGTGILMDVGCRGEF